MQKYVPMTIIHREGETEAAMREDSERGEFYYVADVDARIAELETAGREYVTRTDQQIEAQHERIAELEKELKIARDEISDLRAFIEGMKRHVAAAAKMFGLSS